MDFDRILVNHSYASVGTSPMLDVVGRDVVVVVAKLAYRVDAAGRPTLDSAPVRFVDDNDAGGGIRRPNELADQKPGTDVGLVGTATARGLPQPRALAWLDVGGVKHAVTLVGERSYGARRGEVEPSRPAPLASTPLRWDVAFGGTDRSDPAAVTHHPENPIGRGFARDPATLVGQPAPQILPADGSEGVTAGFGPIPASWQPRLARFGTLDDKWASTRAPIWPRDVASDFGCWSAPGLHRATPLLPSVPIEVGGVCAEGPWKFSLPEYAVEISYEMDGALERTRPHLDGLLIDADDRTVELSFRTSIRLVGKWQRLAKIFVHSVGTMADSVLGIDDRRRVDVA